MTVVIKFCNLFSFFLITKNRPDKKKSRANVCYDYTLERASDVTVRAKDPSGRERFKVRSRDPYRFKSQVEAFDSMRHARIDNARQGVAYTTLCSRSRNYITTPFP